MFLLLGCAVFDLLEVASKVDREHCTFTIEVDAASCPCLEGAAWTAVDAAGETFVSTGEDGEAGLQPVGTTQKHLVEPGGLTVEVTFVYLDGQTSENAGQIECPAGGFANEELVCDCTAFETG